MEPGNQPLIRVGNEFKVRVGHRKPRVEVEVISGGLSGFFLFFLSFLFFSQVLEVVAGSRGEDVESLAETVYENTLKVFSFR